MRGRRDVHAARGAPRPGPTNRALFPWLVVPSAAHDASLFNRAGQDAVRRLRPERAASPHTGASCRSAPPRRRAGPRQSPRAAARRRWCSSVTRAPRTPARTSTTSRSARRTSGSSRPGSGCWPTAPSTRSRGSRRRSSARCGPRARSGRGAVSRPCSRRSRARTRSARWTSSTAARGGAPLRGPRQPGALVRRGPRRGPGRVGAVEAWLAGVDLARAERDADSPGLLGLSPESAKRTLVDLTRLVRALGWRGTLLVVEGTDPIANFPPARRLAAYTVLRELIDNADGGRGLVASRLVVAGTTSLFAGPRSIASLPPLARRVDAPDAGLPLAAPPRAARQSGPARGAGPGRAAGAAARRRGRRPGAAHADPRAARPAPDRGHPVAQRGPRAHRPRHRRALRAQPHRRVGLRADHGRVRRGQDPLPPSPRRSRPGGSPPGPAPHPRAARRGPRPPGAAPAAHARAHQPALGRARPARRAAGLDPQRRRPRPAARGAPRDRRGRRRGRGGWASRCSSSTRPPAASPAATGPCSSTSGCVLATGSSPFVPPIPGTDAAGVFVYRTIEDLEAMRAWAIAGCTHRRRRGRRAARPRGGQRHAAARPGHHGRGDGAAPDGRAARRRRRRRAAPQGRGARASRSAPAWASTAVRTSPDGRAIGLELGDEVAPLDAELVVFAAGIRPRDQLGRDAGLAIGERGGIVIDDGCATSDPAIYAVGEVACHARPGARPGGPRLRDGRRWPPAGSPATTPPASPPPSPPPSSSCSASTWPWPATSEGVDALVVDDPVSGHLPQARARRRRRGDRRRCWSATPVRSRRCRAWPWPRRPPRRRADLLLGAADAGDAGTVCSCHNVSGTAIREAIREGELEDVGAIKACTKAGTGCGSCVSLIDRMLGEELLAAGKEVDRGLCEHFAQSRQELFEVVRVTGIRTFAELAGRFGTGRGCAVCKPAVASMFASLASGYVLDGEQAVAPGHQRPLPRQHPARRHLLGRAPGARRRDHPRGADRHRRGRPRLRPLHEDHRRPAHRPVRRHRRPAPAHLGAADRRRLRVGPRLRQGGAHREVVHRHRPGAATACRTPCSSPSTSSSATGACGRRTRSSWPCPAAPASAPRRRARTSA